MAMRRSTRFIGDTIARAAPASRGNCLTYAATPAWIEVRPLLAGIVPRPLRGRMAPWLPVSACEALGRVAVVDHQAFLGVVNNRPAEVHREVGEEAARGGDVALLDVGDRPAAFLDGGEEIEHMPARGRGGVQLDVRLGHVLGIFFPLIEAFEVQRPGLV